MLKNLLKRAKNAFLWDTLAELNDIKQQLAEQKQMVTSLVQLNQAVLQNQLKDAVAAKPDAKTLLSDLSVKVHSQFEEDGLLLLLFSIIGTTNKQCVEIGCSDGRECNTTNFILYHGWKGLLLDGDKGNVERGNKFFGSHPNTNFNPPQFKQAWITKDNINSLLTGFGFSGEIDLLSIDIDGNDYHILNAITAIQPRVVLCEVNGWIPPTVSNTIPYKEDFYCWDKPYPEVFFRSLSPAAAVKLMAQKGYRLVAAHREGFNLFFIKNELGGEQLPTITAEEVYNRVITDGGRKIWNDVKDMPWLNV